MNEDGALLVKVFFKPSYFKPSLPSSEGSLSEYEEILAAVRDRLTVHGAPNVMPFRWFKETAHAAYLVSGCLLPTLCWLNSLPPYPHSLSPSTSSLPPSHPPSYPPSLQSNCHLTNRCGNISTRMCWKG